MDRENFYQLLDLPIDPPENDLKKISVALRSKQAEWSRLRNHPTKGLQARTHIGLISEIRRVMSNPELRKEEAEAALELIRGKKREKTRTISRHIRLLSSKGGLSSADVADLSRKHGVDAEVITELSREEERGDFAKLDKQIKKMAGKGPITEKDAAKLSKSSGMDPEEVRRRIEALRKDTFDEIDNYLKIRTTKEYITEKEIAGLARLYDVGEDEILRRVNCPVRKKGMGEEDAVKPLDRTIEGVIRENLGIVGKSSLYDFLDLWIGSDLETLQKSAGEKEMEIRKSAKKDTFVTAGGILAGHCISIFKTAESRNAYDLSRARARLKELNFDIDVAGMGGRIRLEYFDFLKKRAVGFGVDPEEAEAHIKSYCEKHGWPIQEPPKKKKPLPRKPLIIAGVVVLAVILAVSGWMMYSMHVKSAYIDLLKRVENERTLEKKIKLLDAFVQSRDPDDQTEDAENRIARLHREVLERDFAEAMEKAVKLENEKEFENAGKVYEAFLKKHPGSAYAQTVEKKKARVPELIDDDHFHRLTQIPPDAFEERIDACQEYLTARPDGRHREKVRGFIVEMEEPYYLSLKHSLAGLEAEENWGACIENCQRFLAAYDKGERVNEITDLLALYRKKMADAKLFTQLKVRAKFLLKNDPDAARRVYLKHLEENPDSTVRAKVEAALKELNDEERKKLLAKGGGRYKETAEGVILDASTNLMWCVLESAALRNECVDYKTAIRYVKDLKAGGYKDWRLPTPSELIGIYHREPILPFGEKKWYWTSKRFKQYADGWSTTQVSVIGAKNGKGGGKQRVDSRECGAVRAVRP